MKAIVPLFALTALLAACAAPPRPAPVPPPPRPFVTPGLPPPLPPKQPANWRDAPASPGNWYWRTEGNRSIAFFGTPTMPTYGGFTLTCDKATRQVEIRQTAPALEAPLMTIVTTSGQKTLPTRRDVGDVVAVVAGSDPLLDSMAFSRGRFMVSVQGQWAPWYLPAWPEISRVIEDCR